MTNRRLTQCFGVHLIPATLGTFLLLAFPALTRGADFQSLLSGKTHPLSVKLGDLDAQWRRITIHSSGSISGNISVSVSGNGTSGSSQNNISDLAGSKRYLTKGQTVSAYDQVYLVAYHLPGGLDLPTMIQSLATKSPPSVSVLTPETTLPLSLLDVKTVGTLDDIHAFDLKNENADGEKLYQTLVSAIKASGGSGTNSPSSSQSKSTKQ